MPLQNREVQREHSGDAAAFEVCVAKLNREHPFIPAIYLPTAVLSSCPLLGKLSDPILFPLIKHGVYVVVVSARVSQCEEAAGQLWRIELMPFESCVFRLRVKRAFGLQF